MTPSLPAAQPATYTIEGRTIRPLGKENDKAFALINALDAQAARPGDPELSRRRSRPRAGSGRANDSTRRAFERRRCRPAQQDDAAGARSASGPAS